MGLFNKKPDPITDRSKELNAQIAALESKIKKLNNELETGHTPHFRSTVSPGGIPNPVPAEKAAPPSGEPVFEKVDQNPLQAPPEPPATPQHFNELGVRKYDLSSWLKWLRKQFQAPPTANPKLVNYLAAGSVQGLRPLRYEKRVARNRFWGLLLILAIVCLLIISYAFNHRH